MSFRDRMKVPVSKAEIQIMQELSRLNKTERMLTQKPICLKMTVPDFSFHMENANYAIYIDAEQTHKTREVQDCIITSELTA